MLSRRQLLLAGAGTLVLAACGKGGDSDGGDGELTLARVFSPEQPAGTPLRLPLALAGADGLLLDDVPAELQARIGQAGGDLSAPVTVERHADGIERAYFPFRTEFEAPGEWRIVVDADGRTAEVAVAVRDRRELPAVPAPGEQMVVVPTPTTADPLGIDPLCTRGTPCPLHDVSLDAALAAGGPVALLIATPRFCQTAICGPVLELLLEARDSHPDVTMIHAEVYVNEDARRTTPTVDAYGLTYEPALFVADATGKITSRLDYTFDRAELARSLEEVAS
jgi:hypothetical protein